MHWGHDTARVCTCTGVTTQLVFVRVLGVTTQLVFVRALGVTTQLVFVRALGVTTTAQLVFVFSA